MSADPASPAPRELPTAIIHDDSFLEHDPGSGHPESPQRYLAVMNALAASEFVGQVRPLPARPATDEELTACHLPGYVELVQSIEAFRQHVHDGRESEKPA